MNTSTSVYRRAATRVDQLSKSKSRGGFCSNQSRSCSGVSWRKSGVSSSTSSSPGGGSSSTCDAATLPGASPGGGRCSAVGGSSSSQGSGAAARGSGSAGGGLGLARLGQRVELLVGGQRRGLVVLELGRQLGLGRHGRDVAGLVLHVGHGVRGGRARIAQRLVLLSGDLVRIRATAALELEVLADGVVEQSHQTSTAYSALTVRFLPERLAR